MTSRNPSSLDFGCRFPISRNSAASLNRRFRGAPSAYKHRAFYRAAVARRGTVLINVAEFDRATGEATDIVRATNGAPKGANGRSQIYSHEQARRAGYDADLKKLELDEKLRKLIPVEEVVLALHRVADVMVRVIDNLPSRADDVALAVAANGEAGARKALKTAAYDWRVALAEAIEAFLASERKTLEKD